MGQQIRNIATTVAPADSSRASTVIVGGVLADLIAVIVFVVIGRNSHDDPLSVSGVLATGWPFMVGIIGGYIGIALTGWRLLGLRGGAVLVVNTVIIGMLLRSGVAGEGTPFSFVVVTTVVLTVLMLGWRAVALRVLRRPER